MLTEERKNTAESHPYRVPPHPHFTLGSVAVIGVVIAVIAALMGFGTALSLANRDDMDRALVENAIDERFDARAQTFVEELPASSAVVVAPAGEAQAAEFGSVLPELTPIDQLQLAPESEVNTSYAPNVPPASGRTAPAIVEVEFDVVENVSIIDPATGLEFETWGYRLAGDDASVATGTPGPMVRARVGDVLRFKINNPAENASSHNVDFHAVTGQGGGAAASLVAPGETAVFEARMLYPGIFMYHCAAGDVPAHIAHGMYGGILVDPETPLPAAEKEFYVVQSEYYLTEGEDGTVILDRQALTDENPQAVVFNGAKGAIAGDNALQMAVGDRARFYFVNAGLNLDSNFHPIGSHWDAVWPEGATLNPPLRGSQTTLVPAGGGVVVDLLGQVPSDIVLVDHALTRAFDKGAIGIVSVVGDENPEIFSVGESEAAPTEAAPAVEANPDAVEVAMPLGAWAPQPLDAADEFDDVENPVDYSVNVLTVPVGTTVEWVNNDDQAHTVTDVEGLFDSGTMGQGDRFSFTFDTPGTYEYFCIPHPWMRARVVVEG